VACRGEDGVDGGAFGMREETAAHAMVRFKDADNGFDDGVASVHVLFDG
jgi:hypothetical protein